MQKLKPVPNITNWLRKKLILKRAIFAVLALTAASIGGYLIAAPLFVPGDQPTGFVGTLELTNVNLKSGNEIVFKTDYEKEYWSGNVFAYPIDEKGQINEGGEIWIGGVRTALDAANFDYGRTIVTMKGDGTRIPFRWDSLSSTQQVALGTATTGPGILNFVRGSRSSEIQNGGTYRDRQSVLGDIIHSRATYVKNGDSPVLFVGANDGMLHAFDASRDGGNELWAYVPSMLIANLKNLTVNPYEHAYFVDGGLSVGDVVIAGTKKTVLVGGLGAGGRGLYALDISNPNPTTETAAKDSILWEITPSTINNSSFTDYANLGYTYGTPQIGKLNTGEYAAIFGNGYNNTGNGRASLYVVNVSNGQLIREIPTDTSGGITAPNGLSSPFLVDADGDGDVDAVYAGDLDGRLWKFNLSANTAASWSSTMLYATSPAQAITVAPTASIHPMGGYMVTFGTGRMLSIADPNNDVKDTATYYAYGVWDGAPATNTSMLTQNLAEKSYTFAGATTRVRVVTTNNVPNWAPGGTKGWKVALPTAGERFVGDGLFQENERFYFRSYNPTINNADPIPDGENWLFELDYLSGGTKNSPFLDMNGDLVLNSGDRIKYAAGDVLPSGKAVGDTVEDSNGVPVGKMVGTGITSNPVLVELKTLNTTLLNQNPDVVIPANSTVTRGVNGGHFDVDFTYHEPTLCNISMAGGSRAGGSVTFTYSGYVDLTNLTIKVGAETLVSGNPSNKNKSGLAQWVDSNETSSNYSVNSNGGTLTITAVQAGEIYNLPITVIATGNNSNSASYSVVNMNGGVDGTISYNQCPVVGGLKRHSHQYDDLYDVTGIDMLNPSDTQYDLEKAISKTTSFKLLVHNQYLNPAVKIKIGGAPYSAVKNFTASGTLDVTSLPSYKISTMFDFKFNMPVSAFTPADWWGNGDRRVGLHPTMPGCVWDSTNLYRGAYGSNVISGQHPALYQPVIPPVNGTDGPGTIGTTSGARRNGALVLQIIAADTPDSAVELNVASRPEYGWRVRSNYYEKYVLAEYVVYWHGHYCYGSPGWTKAPGPDVTSSIPKTPASGSTDPREGNFGTAGVSTMSVNTVVNGNVTTITTVYSDSTRLVVTKTKNADGTNTIRSVFPDGTTTVVVVGDTAGDIKTGGNEKGAQSKTGRIAWSELLRQ